MRTWLWQQTEVCSSGSHCTPIRYRSEICVSRGPDMTWSFPQWTLPKRTTHRGTETSIEKNYDNGLLRIKDLRGSHKGPVRHLGQGATRERYQLNSRGQSGDRCLSTIHKALHQRVDFRTLPWLQETNASSQQFSGTEIFPAPYASHLALSSQALEEKRHLAIMWQKIRGKSSKKRRKIESGKTTST